MSAPPSPASHRPVPIAGAVALCILIAGTLDIADALLFYGIRSGTSPQLLLQVIASGLLGAQALRLGLAGALLGLAIHYSITAAWSTLYVLAALRLPTLVKRPGITGPLYGLLIYFVMNFLVLPHTREVGRRSFAIPVVLNAVAALIFCMGLPIALITRRTLRASL